MDKPKEDIEYLRALFAPTGGMRRLFDYLDSIPDDAVPVVWPKELTRERLEEFATAPVAYQSSIVDALRALAAIAPERKKRTVNLWERKGIGSWGTDDRMANREYEMDGWRKVAGPIEIDE